MKGGMGSKPSSAVLVPGGFSEFEADQKTYSKKIVVVHIYHNDPDNTIVIVLSSV